MIRTNQLTKARAAVAAAAILILVGSAATYASTQSKTFHSGYEFQVYDPNEPVVSTSVNGSFIDSPIDIQINMSSHDGVKKLSGTFSVTVQLYNDTSGVYEPFQTLASGKSITLTTTPVTMDFPFTTSTPGDYNVDVEFNATSVVLA